LMMWELGRSIGFRKWYVETSCKKQELAKGPMEVGLTGSTQRTGKPATWPPSSQGYGVPRGSGQRKCNDSSNDMVLRNRMQQQVDKLGPIAVTGKCTCEEPYVGKPQVRFCEGARVNNQSLISLIMKGA
jgi:hypothetical protein